MIWARLQHHLLRSCPNQEYHQMSPTGLPNTVGYSSSQHGHAPAAAPQVSVYARKICGVMEALGRPDDDW